MDMELKRKADLMVDNYHVLKAGFKWDSNLIKHFGAMMYTTKDKRVDIERLKEIKNFIKRETGVMSYFRGNNEFIMTVLLSFEENYTRFFKNILDIYEKMKVDGFKRSYQLPLAAYTIAKESQRDQWNYRIQRTSQFFEKMKKNHFWLTSSDDYVYAAVLACTDLEVEETSRKIEECYGFLNNQGFYKGNDLQTLSHILAMGEENTEEKCSRAVNLYRKLKENHCKVQYSGLATLGLVSLIAEDVDKITREIKEVFDYISEKDGYGFWSIDKNTKVILATTLVSDFYVNEIEKGVLQIALSNSISSILIAQQQAAIAAACAASAAAASASSSS